MNTIELWENYLDVISLMTEGKGLYGLDNRRSNIHFKLVKRYKEVIDNFDEERFKEIVDNLDRVLGESFPLELNDIKYYSKILDKQMICGLLNKYSKKHIDKFPHNVVGY